MGKLKKSVGPYSFHSRVISILLICTLVASAVAMVLSYAVSRGGVRSEFLDSEEELALSMLELDQNTALTGEEIIAAMGTRDSLSVALVWEESSLLPEIRQALDSQGYAAFSGNYATLPITWVKLGGQVYCIQPSPKYNIFATTSVRIASACLSFAAVFLLMVSLVSSRISRPVTTLTSATRRVAEGDFTVRVPVSEAGEVGELMASFNSMTEALGRNAWLQKDFIANISHEFRTPIAAIKGYAMLLQMPGLDENQRSECIQTIAGEADRLSRLSDTLLRLSALEQRAVEAAVSRVRLDEQIRQAIVRLEPIWAEKAIEWELELDETWADTDADLLAQVWTNLVQNAIKFSPVGGAITVRLRQAAGSAVVTVADQGPGMDAETLSHIFERFYQGDRSRRSEGTGIGLCLVQRILTLLGGDVQAASTVGEGSVFTVTLPLRSAGKGGNP